jgi:hypothetical protein
VSDATQLIQPAFSAGAAMPRRHITLVPVGGRQIRVLVPVSSVAVSGVMDLPDTPIAIHSRESELVAEFDSLVSRWKADTQYLSGANIELHPAYLRIIGMGERAVPLILSEMKRSGGHWFWALEAITGDNPARNASTVTEGIAAWLEWGQLRKLV